MSEFIPFLSDCHCKISWEILAKHSYVVPSIKDRALLKAPINYTWSKDSDIKFQEALNTSTIQSKISNFMNQSNACSSENIAKIIGDFEDIILSAANLSLRKPKVRNKKIRTKNGLIVTWVC